MHIFLSGASSILGTAIMESFFNSGHTIFSLSHLPRINEDYKMAIHEKIREQHFDIVILLTGEDIFDTTCIMPEIQKKCANQILANEIICSYFSERKNKPHVILSVSSIHYYNNDTSEPVSEQSDNGSDFLADYFSKLETATTPASEAGIRVLNLRLGKVISKSSEPVYSKLPLLPNRLPSFLNDTNRLVSWVSQEDAVRAIYFILENKDISNPVNIASGDTVSKDEFNNSVAKEFRLRKTVPLPPTLLKIMVGQESSCLFNNSSRAIPLKLMEAGFLFNNISLQEYFQETI